MHLDLNNQALEIQAIIGFKISQWLFLKFNSSCIQLVLEANIFIQISYIRYYFYPYKMQRPTPIRNHQIYQSVEISFAGTTSLEKSRPSSPQPLYKIQKQLQNKGLFENEKFIRNTEPDSCQIPYPQNLKNHPATTMKIPVKRIDRKHNLPSLKQESMEHQEKLIATAKQKKKKQRKVTFRIGDYYMSLDKFMVDVDNAITRANKWRSNLKLLLQKVIEKQQKERLTLNQLINYCRYQFSKGNKIFLANIIQNYSLPKDQAYRQARNTLQQVVKIFNGSSLARPQKIQDKKSLLIELYTSSFNQNLMTPQIEHSENQQQCVEKINQLQLYLSLGIVKNNTAPIEIMIKTSASKYFGNNSKEDNMNEMRMIEENIGCCQDNDCEIDSDWAKFFDPFNLN